jgi:hypothetical protein
MNDVEIKNYQFKRKEVDISKSNILLNFNKNFKSQRASFKISKVKVDKHSFLFLNCICHIFNWPLKQ